MYVIVKEGDMEGGDGPGKSDRVATIETLKEKNSGLLTTLSCCGLIVMIPFSFSVHVLVLLISLFLHGKTHSGS
jgi:hypothetical protein